MKKSIFSFLFVFALSSFFANMAFAATPIPGISIVVKRNPGGIVFSGKTDRAGKFSYKFDKAGTYYLQISYDEIIRKLNTMKTNKTAKNNYEITLTFTGSKGLTVNGNSVGKITINKQTGIISLNVPEGGGSISGTLEWSREGDPHEVSGDGFN